MLRLYLKALWRHWTKFLTSGALIAVATAWVLTGYRILPVVGAGIVVVAFLQASFGAWKEEQQRAPGSTPPSKLLVRQIEYAYDENWPTIHFTVANIGGSSAQIVRSSIRVWATTKNEPWPGYPPYRDGATEMDGVSIPAGGTERFPYQDRAEHWDLLIGHIAHDNVDTVLLGFIEYQDMIGTLRRVGFCRRQIANSTRFEAVDDPDYEYAD